MELKGLIGKRRNKKERRRKEGIRTRQGFGELITLLKVSFLKVPKSKVGRPIDFTYIFLF